MEDGGILYLIFYVHLVYNGNCLKFLVIWVKFLVSWVKFVVIWVKFVVIWVKFVVIWVKLVVIWYIFFLHFGILYQEKSGNPGRLASLLVVCYALTRLEGSVLSFPGIRVH
jgi:hypothetical protein